MMTRLIATIDGEYVTERLYTCGHQEAFEKFLKSEPQLIGVADIRCEDYDINDPKNEEHFRAYCRSIG